MESGVQCSSEAHGVQQCGPIDRNRSLGGSTRGFSADSATHYNYIIPFKENEVAAFVSPLHAGAVPGESADFAFERGDDGNLKHSHWLGTTRPRGVTRHPRRLSSIPNRARLWRNWPTFFSCPCGRFRWWP